MTTIIYNNIQFKGFNKHFTLKDALLYTGSRYIATVMTRKIDQKLLWYEL